MICSGVTERAVRLEWSYITELQYIGPLVYIGCIYIYTKEELGTCCSIYTHWHSLGFINNNYCHVSNVSVPLSEMWTRQRIPPFRTNFGWNSWIKLEMIDLLIYWWPIEKIFSKIKCSAVYRNNDKRLLQNMVHAKFDMSPDFTRVKIWVPNTRMAYISIYKN